MKLRTSEKLYVLERDGKFVLVDGSTGAWIRTNHVGCEVILRCDETREAKEIAREIAEVYRVPVELIQGEIEAFIESASREGIVLGGQISPASTSMVQELNTVWFHVTRRCNLSCVYCYAGGSMQLERELSITEINRTLGEIATLGPYLVYITGGEPLMRADLWEIEPHGLRLRLITNGTLVDEGNYRKIADKFAEVQVSIDGPDPETHQLMRPNGSFDASMKAMRLLGQLPFERRIISCTATRLNYERIPEMVPWAYDLGWSLFLSRLMPTGKATLEHYLDPETYDGLVERCHQAYAQVTKSKGKPAFPFFFQAACTPYSRVMLKDKRTSCGIGSLVVSIDATGDVYPCPLLHVPEFRLGSLRESSFPELVGKAPGHLTYLDADRLEGCRDCYVKRLCGGGCRALAYHVGKGITGEDPYCSVTRKAIENAFWI
jgi:radical SAM protein with 4Fe4S-binding SPASM domain